MKENNESIKEVSYNSGTQHILPRTDNLRHKKNLNNKLTETENYCLEEIMPHPKELEKNYSFNDASKDMLEQTSGYVIRCY